MQLKLTLTIPWAKRANDIDLHLACDVGTVLLAVPKYQVERLDVAKVPVRAVAGLGDFELEVKETGLQAPETLKAGGIEFFINFICCVVSDERTTSCVMDRRENGSRSIWELLGISENFWCML